MTQQEQTVSSGVALIAAERQRQIEKGYAKGHEPEHDQRYYAEVLLDASKAYLSVASPGGFVGHPLAYWPFGGLAFEPKGARESDDPIEVEDLVKAGAFIAAAIDRLTEGTS